jgi:hypothetical protein
MARNGIGRPYGGRRLTFPTRPARPAIDLIRDGTDHAGMSSRDVGAVVPAYEFGILGHAPVPTSPDREELPIPAA